MPTLGGSPGDCPAAAHDENSIEIGETGRSDRAARPRRLETDEDVTRILQEHYPLIDDPAARAAIVAQFARRDELRAHRRRAHALRIVVVGLFVLATAVGWSVFWPRLQRWTRRA